MGRDGEESGDVCTVEREANKVARMMFWNERDLWYLTRKKKQSVREEKKDQNKGRERKERQNFLCSEVPIGSILGSFGGCQGLVMVLQLLGDGIWSWETVTALNCAGFLNQRSLARWIIGESLKMLDGGIRRRKGRNSPHFAGSQVLSRVDALHVLATHTSSHRNMSQLYTITNLLPLFV